MTLQELNKKAAEIRVDTLRALHKTGRSFLGGNMSVVEILVALYYGSLGQRPAVIHDPTKPQWDEQDYVLLSKERAATAWYSVLADRGFFDKDDVPRLADVPDVKVPGVCASVLSCGVGLSVGAGIAQSLKMDRKENRVYVVLGDGELQCGQVWEAANFASHYKLNNLIAIVDDNKMPTLGERNFQDRFEAFGWEVVKVSNGHDIDSILDAIVKGFKTIRKPVCIWCQTVSGKGVMFAEGKEVYHDASLSEAELNEAVNVLTKRYE